MILMKGSISKLLAWTRNTFVAQVNLDLIEDRYAPLDYMWLSSVDCIIEQVYKLLVRL